MERTPEMKELWAKIEAKQEAYREAHPEAERGVICPFSDDMACTNGCPDNRNRACVNGED